MTDVLIIGGGAAGMMCAVQAAQTGTSVLLLERMDKVGKKILATGNGRCNLMNTGELHYPCGSDFAQKVLGMCDAQQQINIWHDLGLMLRQEDGGRVYPASGAATTVLDILRLAMERHNVRVETESEAERIIKQKDRFTIVCKDKREYQARKVFVAGGGCAQPKLGSNGSAAMMLKCLGHHVVPYTPALTQVRTDTTNTKAISGIRVRAQVNIYEGAKLLHSESGEVLFTDYGLSGVCIMNSASFITPNSNLELDLLPGFGIKT